ncbi:hypothetical protein LTR37_018519 [Vermiconidia calcicola]|uniref:Uncharacterized protein n=1 Tax=Vermiconidia calcicola TaxID=1690605 RepID=A0ACC3MIM3_9PEZI|nr:hypothetical protein LTR37_018519 [Vermiconidia calcicola]
MSNFIGINADGTPARSSSMQGSNNTGPPVHHSDAPVSVFDHPAIGGQPNANAPIADMVAVTSYNNGRHYPTASNGDYHRQAASWPSAQTGVYHETPPRDAFDAVQRLDAELKGLQQERVEDRKDLRAEIRRQKQRLASQEETFKESDEKAEAVHSKLGRGLDYLAQRTHLENQLLATDIHNCYAQTGGHVYGIHAALARVERGLEYVAERTLLEFVQSHNGRISNSNRLALLEGKMKAESSSLNTLGFTVEGRFLEVEKRIKKATNELKADSQCAGNAAVETLRNSLRKDFSTLTKRISDTETLVANESHDAALQKARLDQQLTETEKRCASDQRLHELVENAKLQDKRFETLERKVDSILCETITHLASALQKQATAGPNQIVGLQNQVDALRSQVESKHILLNDVSESVFGNAEAVGLRDQFDTYRRESDKAVARCERSLNELARRHDEQVHRPADNMYTDGRINVLTSHLQRVDRRVMRNISQTANRLGDLQEHLARSEGRFADELGHVREDSSQLESKVIDLDCQVQQTDDQARRLDTQRCQSLESIVENSETFRTEVRCKMKCFENTLESLQSRIEMVASKQTSTSDRERSRIIGEIGHLLQTACDSPNSVVHPPAPTVATGSDNVRPASKASAHAMSPDPSSAEIESESTARSSFQPTVTETSGKATASDILNSVDVLVATNEVARNGHQVEETEVLDGDDAYQPSDHEQSVQDPPRRSCRRRVA